MNTTLWVLQGILATVFTASGMVILLFKDKLKNRLSWLADYPPGMVTFICISKILGAAGLILPVRTGILPVLTPIAALGLATIMLLAFLYHVRKHEYKDLPATILFFGMALLVAIGRFI